MAIKRLGKVLNQLEELTETDDEFRELTPEATEEIQGGNAAGAAVNIGCPSGGCPPASNCVCV